jgi:monoamine oxidase
MSSTKIAIIGGGPGGLLTAYLLNQRTTRACEITIFEAGHRLGGKIATGTFKTAPITYEAGAAELYDYSQTGPDPLAELISKLGLSRRPMCGHTVILGDAILKTDQDVRQHLGEKTLSAIKDFTRKAKSLISPAEYYESDWRTDNQDPLAKQTFAQLLQTVPDAAARKYIEVSIHSDLATEPHRTNAVYGLQNYLMNEPGYMSLYSIDGGIERLVHELTRRVKAKIALGHRITKVERGNGESLRVHSRHQGESRSDEFDFVVCALPNNWIPLVEWGGEKLCRAMHAHHVHYDCPAHYLRVSVLFEKPFWRDQIAESYFMSDAFGGCCIYDETSRLDGVSFGVLGWLLAGEAAATMSNLPDSVLIDSMFDSLPASMQQGRAMKLEGIVHRWVGSVNGLPAGSPAREPDSRHVPEPEAHGDLFVVGDYLFDSTLNGVMDSADTVAEWIVEEMED